MGKDIDFKMNDLIEDFSGTFHVVLEVNRIEKILFVADWKKGINTVIGYSEVMNCWQEKH